MVEASRAVLRRCAGGSGVNATDPPRDNFVNLTENRHLVV
jgi:hypothetical protein